VFADALLLTLVEKDVVAIAIAEYYKIYLLQGILHKYIEPDIHRVFIKDEDP
jgi:hypothetical protein